MNDFSSVENQLLESDFNAVTKRLEANILQIAKNCEWIVLSSEKAVKDEVAYISNANQNLFSKVFKYPFPSCFLISSKQNE